MKHIPSLNVTLLLLASSTVAASTGCNGTPEPGHEQLGVASGALSECVDIRRDVTGNIEDAYIWSLYPWYNTGTVVDQSMGLSHGGTQYGVLKATLDAIPAGATIDSASLTVLMSAGSAHTIRAHRITTPWTESGVTWDSLGGGYSSAVESSVVVSTYGVETTLDLTGLVQAWVNGTAANDGVLLETELDGATVSYKSSERGTLSQRPLLHVCYTTDGETSSSGGDDGSGGAGGDPGTGGAGGDPGSGDPGTGSTGAGGDPAPEGFVPTDIPGCRWWLRADSVTTNGQYVTGIDDKSGHGHAVSQSDPARWATYIPSSPAFNGQPTIHFNKSQFYEKVGGISMPFGSAPVSALMVGSIDSLPDIGPNGFFAYYAGGATHMYARVQGINAFRVYAENSYTSTLNAGTQGTAHIFGFTFAQNDLHTYRDGMAGETFAAQMWGGTSNPSLRVGTTDAGTPYSLYGGQIAEIMLFDSVLSTSDRQALEAYLKARYGIQ